MTVHKAQEQTMGRVIVDLTGCTGTEPPIRHGLEGDIFERFKGLARLRLPPDHKTAVQRIEKRILSSDASEVANNRKAWKRYRD